MRALVALLLLAACGSSARPGVEGDDMPIDGAGSDGGPPAAKTFQIKTPAVSVRSGEEVTYCYYFRTANTEDLAIHKWSSTLDSGVHHAVLFLTHGDFQPEGTMTTQNCTFSDFTSLQGSAIWTYASEKASDTVELPADDGAGKPLAQLVPAGTSGFIQIHYLNVGDSTVSSSVTIDAEALPDAAPYTSTQPYITYQSQLDIPAPSNGKVFTQTCNTPANTKFWRMSMHAHKHAAMTEVINGMPTSTDVAFMSTDWNDPGAAEWMSSPFYTFTGDKLTFSCTYNNAGPGDVHAGERADKDEMCMATGYMFPATEPELCVCAGPTCVYP
jgi:phage gp46-like protein